jgi:uncharacterized membrane protein
MSTDLLVVVTVFVASAVEAVEALTIVLAVGIVRGWRSTLIGVAAASLVLLAVVAVLGPALRVIPISALRVVVGVLLLTFGLQWLRKAVLRAAGYKALHDEELAFAQERELASSAPSASSSEMDWYAFTVSFKGVLLEGLEVAFIVVGFSTSSRTLALAASAAVAAALVVIAVGIAVRGPLARVPENTLKFAVGVLLSSFGVFWAAEGAGAEWPGSDAAVVAIALVLAAVALALTRSLRRRRLQLVPAEAPT